MTFPIGDTTVTCSATDAAGNTRTGEFTVRLEPIGRMSGSGRIFANGKRITFQISADVSSNGSRSASLEMTLCDANASGGCVGPSKRFEATSVTGGGFGDDPESSPSPAPLKSAVADTVFFEGLGSYDGVDGFTDGTSVFVGGATLAAGNIEAKPGR